MLMKARAASISLSEESFSALVASVSDYAIFLLDAAGTVVSWNVGAERIKGYRADEIIGREYALFFTPEDREDGRPDAALRAARTEGRYRFEGWRLRKDGSRFWASVALTALKNADGELRGYLKVTRDLTEDHLAAERLYESEKRFNAFMNASAALIFIKDRAGRYLYANDRFLERFGLRREQAIGRTDFELFERAQAERFIENDARVFARGTAIETDEMARYTIGERISLVNKFPIRDGRGEMLAIGGIATDITDRKRMEQELNETAAQLRAMSKRLAEVQEAERRRLAQELHDRVGQNLTALNINLNVILNQLQGNAGDAPALRNRLTDSLRLLQETAHSIEDVMSDLLPPMLADFGLFAALRWYAELFGQRTALAVAVNGQEAEPRLPADRESAMFRIAQAAMDNVAKHAHAKRIDIDFRAGPGAAVMTIADDGVGFDLALLDRPYGSARWGVLSLRERARVVGGQLNIESAPGNGTKVTIVLER